MKKIIVAALAVAMLSSVASAAVIGDVTKDIGGVTYQSGDKRYPVSKEPGGSIKIGPKDFWNGTYDAATDSWTIPEDGKIKDEIDFTDEYFVVSAKKFSKGAALVKSIAFVDDGTEGYCLKISLNQDYNNDISRYTNNDENYANLVFSELSIKAKKTVKDADDKKILSKGKEFKFRGTGKLYGQIGYKFTTKYYKQNNNGEFLDKDGHVINTNVDGWKSKLVRLVGKDALAKGNGMVMLDGDDFDLTVKYDTAMAYKFEDGTVGDTVYSYAVINATYGDIAYTEGRVYDGDKVIYKYDQSVNTSILKAYPDAEIEFVNMKTSDLPATCYFELYADEDEYVYKVENGKLVKSGLKWDEDVYAWVGKYRTPCTYVISDIPLSLTPARDEVNVSEIEVIAPIEVVPSVPVVVVNPETGR